MIIKQKHTHKTKHKNTHKQQKPNRIINNQNLTTMESTYTTHDGKGFWSFTGCLEHFSNKQEVVDYILSLDSYRRPLEGRITHFLKDYTIYEAATFSMASGEMVVSKNKRYARY